MKVGTLEIELLADMARLVKDMGQVKRVVDDSMSRVAKAVNMAKVALGALGATALAVSFARNVKAAVDYADGLNKLSQKSGIAVESLSQLLYVAKMADVSQETLAGSIRKLNISIAEGRAGDKEKIANFKALGITTADLGKGTDFVMLKMADAYKKGADGASKVTVGNNLMGKSADEMIPFLNAGGRSIRELMREADRLGLTIGGEFAAAAEEFNDNLTRVQASGQKLYITFGTEIVEGMGKAMKAMADATVEGGKLAGVLAGLSTWLFGDQRHQTNVAIVDVAERILALQNAIDKSRAAGDTATLARREKLLKAAQREYEVLRLSADVQDKQVASAKAAADALKNAQTQIKTPGKGDMAAEYDALIKRIRERIDLAKAEAKAGRELTDEEKFEVKTLSELAELKKKFPGLSEASAKALVAESKALALANANRERELKLLQLIDEWHQQNSDETRDAFVAASQARDQAALSLHAEKEALEDNQRLLDAERSSLGLSNRERTILLEQLRIQLKLERDLQALGNDPSYDAAQKTLRAEKLREVADISKAQVAQRAELEEFNTVWQSIDRTAHDVFVNIFEGGSNAFKKLGQTLKASLLDLLYQMTVKKWIISIGASVTGAGAAAQAGGAIAGGGGGFNMDALTNGMGMGGIAGGLGAFGSTAGSVGQAVWLGNGALGSMSIGAGLKSGVAMLANGQIGAGLGAMAGALGPIALGVAAIMSLVKSRGGPKDEGTFNYANQGTRGEAATTIAQGIQDQYRALAEVLKINTQALDNLGVSFAKDPKGDAMTMLDVTNYAGYSRGSRMGTTENVGRDDAAFDAAVAEEAYRVIAHTMQAQEGLNAVYKEWLAAITNTTPYEKVKEIVDHITKAGGERAQLEARLFDITASELEKIAKTREAERAAIDPTNLALLEQIYAQEDLQRQLNGATDSVLGLTRAQQEALDLLHQRQDLEAQIAEAMGDTTAVLTLQRQREIAEMDASLRPLAARLHGLQDEATASAAAVEATRQLVAAMDTLKGNLASTLNDARSMLQAVYDNEKQILLARLAAVDTARDALQRAYDAEAGPLRERIQAIAEARADLNASYQAEAQVLRERVQAVNAARQQLVTSYNAEAAVLRAQIAAIDQAKANVRTAYQAEEAALNARANEIAAARQEVASLYEKESSALTQTISKLSQFTTAIKAFRDSLLVGNLTTLSPEQKLAETERQYRATLAAARGGDETAQGQLQGMSTGYLEAARTYYASSGPYAEIFSQVVSDLGSFGSTAQDVAQQQLDALRQQVGQLTLIGNSGRTLEQAIAHLNSLTAAGDPAAQLLELRAQVSGIIEIDASVKTVAQAIADLNTLTAAGDPVAQLAALTDEVAATGVLDESVKSVAQAIIDLNTLTASGDPVAQLAALDASVAGLLDVNTSVMSVADAIDALTTLTADGDPVAQLAALDASVNGLLTVNDSVLSVPAAIAALLAAQDDADLAQEQLDLLEDTAGALLKLDTTLVSLTEAIAAFNAAKSANDAFLANETFVKGAYQSVLGRGPEAEGLAFYMQQLQSGTHTRDQVMSEILASPENQIINAYRDLLGRTPGMDERKYWQDLMTSGVFADINAVRSQIMMSPEYDGSHAGGLARVPWDGYMAQLHRDERVLTAQDNAIFSGINWQAFGRGHEAVVSELRSLGSRLEERLQALERNTGKAVIIGAASHEQRAEQAERTHNLLDELPRRIKRESANA